MSKQTELGRWPYLCMRDLEEWGLASAPPATPAASASPLPPSIRAPEPESDLRRRWELLRRARVGPASVSIGCSATCKYIIALLPYMHSCNIKGCASHPSHPHQSQNFLEGRSPPHPQQNRNLPEGGICSSAGHNTGAQAPSPPHTQCKCCTDK